MYSWIEFQFVVSITITTLFLFSTNTNYQSNRFFISEFQTMNRKISSRLLTVAQMVPYGSTASDIGSDHGLLSLILSQQCKHVYATDISISAIEGVRNLVKEYSLEDKITVLEGFGLEPIINRKVYSDTIILSGMGLNTISQILKGSNEKLDRTFYRLTEELVINEAMIDLVQINRIIIQPWPPYLLAYLGLIKTFYKHNWIIENQSIEKEGKAHYITSCFVRDRKNTIQNYGSNKPERMRQIFDSMPLSKSYINEPTCKYWKSYVKQQKDNLRSRIDGFAQMDGIGTIVNCEEQEQLHELFTSLQLQVNL